jgi:hypothetical protein
MLDRRTTWCRGVTPFIVKTSLNWSTIEAADSFGTSSIFYHWSVIARLSVG